MQVVRPPTMLVWILRVLLLLSSPARVCSGRCVVAMFKAHQQLNRIQPAVPLYHTEAESACFAEDTRLLFAFENVTDQVKALCGADSLVPLLSAGGPSIRWLASRDFSADVPDFERVEALNVSTGLWHYVGENHTFECVLCQPWVVELQLPDRATVDVVNSEHSPLSKFQVNVTSVDARTSAVASAEELLEVRNALTQLLQPLTFSSAKVKIVPEVYRSSLEGGKLQLEFQMTASILKSVAESSEANTLLGKYLVSVDDRNVCPREETIDADGVVTVWQPANSDNWAVKRSLERSFQVAKNASSRRILRRECNFDDSSFGARWSDVSYWQLEWMECSDDEAFVSEEIYKQFLEEEILYRHSRPLLRYASAPINSPELKTVTRIVNRQVDLTNNIDAVTARDLVNITVSLDLDDGDDVCLEQDTRVYVLVADLEGQTPVLGLTVEYEDGTDAGNLNITLDRTQTEEPRPNQQFALAISDSLIKAHKRLMVFVYWMEMPHPYTIFRIEQRTAQYLEVTVSLVLKSGQKDGALSYGRYSDYFVDLTYRPHRDRHLNFNTVVECSAWNDQLGGWVTEGCYPLKANRGNLTVCRCSAKYFALVDTRGVATARFALNRAYVFDAVNTFTAFFADNTALITVTVAECLLSALGLFSIVATAVLFKAWRRNTGHQILLHMVLALTCNLLLGFLTSFVHFDTESVGCLMLGVLRHYSFLAMFLWMLVLSWLQMKRLMTVAGAKAVTHLILKASLFAWGVPMMPIVILLSWNIRFYQSDRFDRGYCYPEGLVFELTVQAPAGVILIVNFFIFVAIVMNIFECQGVEKITKHSKNENAEQLNKLKTSFFIFFLFGFTWVFHFLSEERIINSDFLFEYLFLMTATTHVFVLALFFIVLQDSTRKEWLCLLGSLRCGSKQVPVASVKATRPAYQPQLPKRIVNRVKKAKV